MEFARRQFPCKKKKKKPNSLLVNTWPFLNITYSEASEGGERETEARGLRRSPWDNKDGAQSRSSPTPSPTRETCIPLVALAKPSCQHFAHVTGSCDSSAGTFLRRDSVPSQQGSRGPAPSFGNPRGRGAVGCGRWAALLQRAHYQER